MRIEALIIGAAAIAAIAMPTGAEPLVTTSVAAAAPQLSGVSADEANQLVAALMQAQSAMQRGDPLYFELLSGAPASYPEAKIAPSDAFLSASFNKPFRVERLPRTSEGWKPYRLTVLPGPGRVLDIEVVLDFNNHIARVEMLWKAPAPF